MQTYYQKHRQIQAFQFDGTFKQLCTELPAELMNDLINHLAKAQFHQQPKWARTTTGQITNLFAQTRNWPLDNYAMHHVSSTHQLRLRYKKLKIGDYVWISYPPTHWKHLMSMTINPYANHNDHNIMWVNWPMVRFTNARNFKTHWSTMPIRKR